MLYNYAKHKGYDLTAAGDLSTFPDSGSVADWAEAARSWANGNELINGHDDGTIDAGGTAIRAQAASILMKFDQNLVKKLNIYAKAGSDPGLLFIWKQGGTPTQKLSRIKERKDFANGI